MSSGFSNVTPDKQTGRHFSGNTFSFVHSWGSENDET